MRDEIIAICLGALARQGVADATAGRLFADPALARACLGLLRDCRPLPVVLSLIAELEPVAAG